MIHFRDHDLVATDSLRRLVQLQERAPVARPVILDRRSSDGQISIDVTPLATSSLIMRNYAPTGAYIHLRSYYLNSPL